MSAVFKVCSCCGVGFTKNQWRALPLVGVQRWPWGEVHELRHHRCGTTLNVVIKEGRAA